MFIINVMRSCSERKILHCVESYLYYIILVNKTIRYIVENIKLIYIRVLTSFSYLFRSEWK